MNTKNTTNRNLETEEPLRGKSDSYTMEKGPTLILSERSLTDLIAHVKVWTPDHPVALDLETTGPEKQDGLRPWAARSRIRLLTLSFQGKTFLLDLFSPLASVPNLLGHLRKRPIVIHNALFDLGWLRAKYGYVHEGEVRCTLTAARVLHNGDDFSYKNDLTSIRVRYLDRTVEEMATDQAKSNWSGDLSGEQIRYAADDVADLHRLWKILSERCRDHDLEDTLDLELSLIPVLIDLQAVGMPFHVGIAMTQENVLRDELAAIDEAIRERLPEPEQPVPKPRARKPPEHLELNCRSTYMLQALALR